MQKTKVAVLFGGCSEEYDVSLKSAYSVITHLPPESYEMIMIGITKEGEWLRYNGSPEKIAKDIWANGDDCVPAIISPDRSVHGIIEFKKDGARFERIDVAFPVLHGKNGEDGTLQGLFEIAGIPFVGCGTLSSSLCMDKDIAHKMAEQVGVKIPLSVVLSHNASKEQLLKATHHLAYPLFVKPVKSGSSFGISLVTSSDELYGAVQTAFEHDRSVIIEEKISGFEVGCAILANDELVVGEVDEIELSHGFFDYTEKYSLKTSKIHMPARIDQETAERIKSTAETVYKALQCKGLARVDMFLTEDHQIVFNEVNTIPGFIAHSRYPNMLKGIGMTFEGILDALIELAVRP